MMVRNKKKTSSAYFLFPSIHVFAATERVVVNNIELRWRPSVAFSL